MRRAVEGGANTRHHPRPPEALKTASPLPHFNNRGGGARAERAGTGRSAPAQLSDFDDAHTLNPSN
jgi:hypothetical protein